MNCLERPLDRQFDYGFSVGGPLYLPRFGEGGPSILSGKNKTFFFFNYGGYRTSQSQIGGPERSDPENAKRRFRRTADRSHKYFSSSAARSRFSIRLSRRERDSASPATAGSVPRAARVISPIGRNFLNLFPVPNQTGPNGSTVFLNYRAATNATAETNYYVTKITHNL